MKIDKYWKLRIRRWWSRLMYKYIYPDSPFEIAYADISLSAFYNNYPKGKILAEFDLVEMNRHYIIYLPE